MHPVRNYFTLQFTMTNRWFRDTGAPPLLAYPAILLVFIGLSIFLFYKLDFAEYIYAFIALAMTGKLSETRRIDFLKICFPTRKLQTIRITENLLVTIPFVVFLCFKQFFITSLILVVTSTLLALVHFRTTFNVAIPTPFSRKPFEFTVGFRNTFYLIFAAYVLTGIAITVGNFNLGVFSMLLIFALCLNFYMKPENVYYVWIFSLSAKAFLLEKIKTAILYSTFLIMPIVLVLGFCFYQHLLILILFLVIGWTFLIGMIVSKYAAYPDEINVVQGILLAMCIWFPPLLLILIPYLFRKSLHRLRFIVE